jgi:hypothetical protein
MFVLKGGKNLKPKINSTIRLIELTSSPTKTEKKFEKQLTDAYCSEHTISEDEARSDAMCSAAVGASFWYMSAWARSLGADARAFVIVGRRVGNCTIKFYENKREVIKLAIEVAEPIKIPVAFHLVHHLRDGRKPHVPHAKSFSESTLSYALERANRILKQSGIIFKLNAFHMTHVDINLGISVMAKSKEDAETKAILLRRDASVKVNVFVLDRITNNGGTSGVTFEKSDVLVEAAPILNDSGDLLAHELSHVLSLGHVWAPFTKPIPLSTKGNITIYAPPPPTHNLMDGGGGNELGLNKNQIGSMRIRAMNLAGGKR